MNFSQSQDQAHQNTQTLIWLFAFSIVCMVVTIYGAALMAFGIASKEKTAFELWQPQIFLVVAIATLILIGGGSWYKLLKLKAGGQVIAEDLGGRLLIAEYSNPAERQLLNVVEEMAIAAGIPVPPVYLLDNEQGINAFAAGYTANDAVIGITRGSLDQLTRDELQGVIGHEFSHILNGDMRLNLKLVGFLHGILLIYLLGRILCHWTNRRSKNNGIVAFGFALIIIGSVGLLCGRLLKSAVSRQREYLADASAVQFTRNPDGIAGALSKISNYHYSSLVHSPYAEENSHLFFGSALNFHFFGEWFATHPPLERRIQRLNGSKRSPLARQGQSPLPTTQSQSSSDLVMGLATSSTPQTVAETSIPSKTTEDQKLLGGLPDSIQNALQNPKDATALVYSLALNPNLPQRERQLTWLQQFDSEIASSTQMLSEVQLEPKMRLPLLDLTIPALRQSPSQYQKLFQGITGLAKANGIWSIADFTLYLVLWHRLQPDINPNPEIKYASLDPVWAECLVTLAAIACVGKTKPDAIAYAFRSGLSRLPGVGQQIIPETPPVLNLSELNKSLKRLSLATPKLKQAIVDACAYTVLLDAVTIQEADLLRAIAITLGCPLPSFLKASPTNKRSKAATN